QVFSLSDLNKITDEGVEFLTNVSALEMTEQPESLIIIGGGYIGCEFGHFFASLGTEVTIIAMEPERLLPAEDEDISDVFTNAFRERVQLHLNSKARAVERVTRKSNGTQRDGVRLTIETGDGKERTLEAERLMIAAGRAPNTSGMGLDATGVETTDKGWIRVDEYLRTTNPHIFAYGDCIGQAMFKHTSSYEGELAYRNAMAQYGERTNGDNDQHRSDSMQAVSYRANPHAVFTSPEIASVGLTEAECRARSDLEFDVARVDYANIAKGEILGSPPGLAKLIIEHDTRKILGFHLAGPHAAMLIHEIVLAMTADLPADAITDTIHIHPTMPELIQKVFGKV
ncbi:MAG: FAD-dependent oxidoreductase, partial [Planctomycetota bacterium]